MEWNTHTQNWPRALEAARGVGNGLSTPRRSPPPLPFSREPSGDEGRTSRTASPQKGARPVRCCVLSALLRHATMVRSRASTNWTEHNGPHQCRWSDTFRRNFVEVLQTEGIGPRCSERAVAGPESSQEGWEWDPYNRPRNLLPAARTEGIRLP